MAITINSTSQTVTKERRVMSFQVNTLPNEDPYVLIYYGEILYGPNNEVLNTKPNIATLKLTKAELIDLLPANNSFGLPTFTSLYVGLRSFLDNQLTVKFPNL